MNQGGFSMKMYPVEKPDCKELTTCNTSPATVQTLDKYPAAAASPLSPGGAAVISSPPELAEVKFVFYKRRWLGLFALTIVNIVSAMNAFWFSAITDYAATYFQKSNSQIYWFANTCNLAFLPVAFVIPVIVNRLGPRKTICVGALITFIAGWIRYAATAKNVSPDGGFAIVIVSQVLVGLAQPMGLALSSKFSELWFDERSRTVPTAFLSVANPFGVALAQLIGPAVTTKASDVSTAILIIACLNVLNFLALLVQDKPPTPASYTSSLESQPFSETMKLLFGKPVSISADDSQIKHVMTKRELMDFWIIVWCFGAITGSFTAFATVLNSLFLPQGYSESAAGNMSAGLILAGLVAAAVTAPLFDKVFTHHLALCAKVLVPIVGGMYMALIWEIKPHNVIPIVVILILLGACLFTLLSVAIELAVEVTRAPEASTGALWWAANLLAVIFIVVMGALTAGPDASPPYNMKVSLAFTVAFVCSAGVAVQFIQGKQRRREIDARRHSHSQTILAQD